MSLTEKLKGIGRTLCYLAMPVVLASGFYFANPRDLNSKEAGSALIQLTAQYSAGSQASPYKTDASFSHDSDKVLIARMLFGEARACIRREKKEIANTALIRGSDDKDYNGIGLRDAVLKDNGKGIHQYSCFNKKNFGKENLVLKQLMNPEAYDAKRWQECLEVAEETTNGFNEDILKNGATHYYNPSAMPYITKKVPVKVTVKAKDGKKKVIIKIKQVRVRKTPSWIYSRKMKCLGRLEVGKNSKGHLVYSKHIFYREK